MKRSLFAFALLAAAIGAFADDCQEFADRSVSISANGVKRVVILGGAGYLHVTGRADATEVRAIGRACAPIEHLLVAMLLKASRKGDTVEIKATVPNEKESFFAAPHLDFAVEVPAGMIVDVADTGGPLTVANTGRLRIVGNSAPIVVSDIHGDVLLQKKHGKFDAKWISGRVREELP